MTLRDEVEAGEGSFALVEPRDEVAIYVLCEPGQGALRYVGSTANPALRLNAHVATARIGGVMPPVGVWIQALVRSGSEPEMYVVDRTTTEHREQVEEEWIRLFEQRGHVLLNRLRPNYKRRARLASVGPERTRREEERRRKYDAAVAGEDVGLLSVEEAAARRGCKPATIYYWIKSGMLICLSYQGVLHVKSVEVDRLPQSRKWRRKMTRSGGG